MQIYRWVVLKANGYSCELPDADSFPKHQVMYTINHNSYLDKIMKNIALLGSTGSIGTQVLTDKQGGDDWSPSTGLSFALPEI